MLRLQVGRMLPWPLLGVAVYAREAVLMGVTHSLAGDLSGRLLAPSWVVATEHSGREVLRAPAGREANAGPELLDDMRRVSLTTAPATFVHRFRRWPWL